MVGRGLSIALAVGLMLTTAAPTVAHEPSGREPVARAGVGDDMLVLPLRGPFEALFVRDCSLYERLNESFSDTLLGGGESYIDPETGEPVTTTPGAIDAPDEGPATFAGPDIEAKLPSGEPVTFDLAPAPYVFYLDEGGGCPWALFLDPR